MPAISHAFRTQGVSYNSSKFESPLFWNDLTFDSFDLRFVCIHSFNTNIDRALSVFTYLLSKANAAIAIYFIAVGIFVRGKNIFWNYVFKTSCCSANWKSFKKQKCLNGFLSHCSVERLNGFYCLI